MIVFILLAYWKLHKLDNYVSFNQAVLKVTQDSAGGMLELTIRDQVTMEVRQEKFDYVISAIGLFSCPNIPELPGMDAFAGKIKITII